ncbi:TolC family protein [Mucilaginibacter ginkgonis]|uniref:TolC family protein n=1 Tax=Mucilaginibacter ginkgonis TaxID=2682091 RepID=A0A6I4I0W6_9SPHI|nr:TolC family protein [Mucilaginibacter ginkgonis]QQL51135.1 TolC family protein [Mucilaginibacter ginkgonis]
MQLNKRITYLFAALLLSFSIPANAQTDTLKINFQDAEKAFLQNNLSLLAQKYNVESTKALIDQARLWDNPTLSTDQNIWDGESRKFFKHGDGFGQVFVQLSQVFLTAGKRGKQIQVAKDNAQVQQAALNDLMRNLRYNLQLDFGQVATLVKQNEVYKNEIAAASNLVDITQKTFDAGNVSMKDLIRLKALLFGLQNDMVENNRQINELQTELKSLMRIKETTFVSPQVNDVPAMNVDLNIASLIEQAKANRPDYLSGQYQLASSTDNLKYQKALASPDVTIGGSFDKNSSYAPNYYGLQIGLPLPVFNRNQGNIKSAKFDMMSQQATLQDTEIKLRNDVAEAVYQYQLNQKLFTTQQIQFNEQYDKLFNAMTTAFKRREISLVEFIDFFESYKDTKLKILQQQYNLQKSIATLNFAVGTTIVKP